MGFTNNRSWGDAPQHPILPNAHRYAIVALQLELEPVDTGGFEILDISSRGLEELGVLVSDSEGAGGGTVRFLARRVEEVRESE